MKYSGEQVLTFTEKTYEKEIQIIGGRERYITTVQGEKVYNLSKVPYSMVVPCGFAFLASIYLVAVNIISLASGFSPIHVFALLCSLASCVLLVNLFLKARRNHANRQEMYKEYALGHEPQALWNFDYPRDHGKRASLIRSLLGARMFARKMIKTTSIPMSNEVIDARIVHLVQELAKAKDDDIHSYLVDEVKSFCRQTVIDINFYSPLISFQDEIEAELKAQLRTEH